MNTEVTVQDNELNVLAKSSSALILDVASMNSIMAMADMMAKGRSTIPTHLAGNASDCAAVIMQAMQWGMNPWAVAQKTHVVSGALGYEAQLVNAVIQSSGVTVDRFNYDWYGPWEKIVGKSKVVDKPATGKYGDKDYKKASQYRVADYDLNDETGLGIRVWATLKGEIEPRELNLLLVQASVRNSPLWATDPKQQLAYLAVKRWTRLYAPDVILGVYTPDEMDQGNHQAQQAQQTRDMGAADVVLVDIEPMIAAAYATKTDADALKYWKDNNGVLVKQLADHKRLKEAVSQHRVALKAKEAARTVENVEPAKEAALDVDFVAAMDSAPEYVQGGD